MTPILTDDDQSNAPNAGTGFNPLAQLRGYWEGLRDHDSIPLRSQISPRGLDSALSCTFLIERIAPGIARFRIAGMELADFMGMEVRGLPFSSIFCPVARNDLALKLEMVFHSPAILAMSLVAERGIGRPALEAELLVLPLRDESGRVAQALGCLALKGKVGRSPRRFDIARASVTRLERAARPVASLTVAGLTGAGLTLAAAARPPAPGFAPDTAKAARTHAFAEAASAFSQAGNAQSGNSHAKPYLRLVK
jgi:hypothetical protein